MKKNNILNELILNNNFFNKIWTSLIYFSFLSIILLIRRIELQSKQINCFENYVFNEICYNLKILDYFYILIFFITICSIIFINKKSLYLINYILTLKFTLLIFFYLFSEYTSGFFIGHIEVFNLVVSVVVLKILIILFSLILTLYKNINEN